MVTLLNCEATKLGPLNTDHVPVPAVGVFPASSAPDKLQTVCVDVFVAVVGEAATVMVASAVEGGHDPLLMDQRTK